MTGSSKEPSKTDWTVEHLRGGAGDLHHRDSDFVRRVLRVNEIDRPALVLASAQNSSVLNVEHVEDAGFEVVTRRSGGGLVHLLPSEHLWVDLFLPRTDPLWVEDVSHSADWLGAVWVEALGSLGVGDLEVSVGGWSDRDLGKVVCFAATGPGEVAHRGRKLVGVSQRRTKAGTRFQCIVYRAFRADQLLGVVHRDAISPGLHARLETVLGTQVASLDELMRGRPTATESLLRALVESLP